MKRLIVPAADENLYAVLDFISDNAEGMSEKIKGEIALAVEEIFINIAHYAYENGNGEVGVTVLTEDHAVTIEFSDDGVAFNPLAKPDPDAPSDIDDAQIGGLGILLVKELMDTVVYCREDNKNIFTISKNRAGIHS